MTVCFAFLSLVEYISRDSACINLKDLWAIRMSCLFPPFAVIWSSEKLLLVNHSFVISAIIGFILFNVVLIVPNENR